MGISKTYKLYVFDLDGTVADTKVDMARALQAAVTAAGFKKPGIDEVVSAIGQGAQKAVQKLTGLGEDEVGPYVDIFMEKYDEFCCDNVTLYPGIKELLYSLKTKSANIALVTMKFKSAVHKILKRLDIDIFDAVQAEPRKPFHAYGKVRRFRQRDVDDRRFNHRPKVCKCRRRGRLYARTRLWAFKRNGSVRA